MQNQPQTKYNHRTSFSYMQKMNLQAQQVDKKSAHSEIKDEDSSFSENQLVSARGSETKGEKIENKMNRLISILNRKIVKSNSVSVDATFEKGDKRNESSLSGAGRQNWKDLTHRFDKVSTKV